MAIIEIKNIGKKYNIMHQRGGYITLRDILTNIFKNPFKYAKHKAKQIVGLVTKEEFWALKNISLEVRQGEVIGIIGPNGAGKSTLLKILTGITPPTEGEIIMQGRIASLLEVGTGFHPELSGRENIMLNGAILGMTKREIVKKFDEIVSFSGIGKFLDTPVKYYSSGMYIRLAFSVAAHMEPDILLVDEVLAVGDTEFQKKCLGKMEEVTKKEGRTILFVSHNMAAIKALCHKTVWLEKGQIKMIGNTDEVVHDYTNSDEEFKDNDLPITLQSPKLDKEIIFNKIWITKSGDKIVNKIDHNENFYINLEFDVNKEIDFAEISICLRNTNRVKVTFTSLSDSFQGKFYHFKPGKYITRTHIRENFLVPDIYTIIISAHHRNVRNIDINENAMRLKVVDAGSTMANYGQAAIHWCCAFSQANWEIKNL